MRQATRILAAAIALLIATLPAAASAAYVVSVGNLALAPGGTGLLNVEIQSNSGTGDALNSFGFDFRITTSGPTRLQFTPTQVDPFTNSSYVFFNNSLDQLFGVPLGTVSQQTVPNDKYVGGDGAQSGSVLVGTSQVLLLALRVTAATSLPPALGDTFTISLVNDSSTFFKLGSASISFTSQPGTVTIASSSVPEPSSLLQGALVAGLALAARLFSTRSRHPGTGRRS
jgi:hypothetical protein